MSSKPRITQSDVEKAQAIARHHVGQAARNLGYDPAQIRAMVTYGKTTVISEDPPLHLLPQTLQVQLCLVEHAKLFPHFEGLTVADGMQRLTHLALIYSDPDLAFEIFTDTLSDEEKRQEFTRKAFALAAHFSTPDKIELLSTHIIVQMQLTDAAAGGEGAKKPPAPKFLGGRNRKG
jgi:hypothetical protein